MSSSCFECLFNSELNYNTILSIIFYNTTTIPSTTSNNSSSSSSSSSVVLNNHSKLKLPSGNPFPTPWCVCGCVFGFCAPSLKRGGVCTCALIAYLYQIFGIFFSVFDFGLFLYIKCCCGIRVFFCMCVCFFCPPNPHLTFADPHICVSASNADCSLWVRGCGEKSYQLFARNSY
jgi:hypothetical protein